MYQVSLKNLKRFSSYRADTICDGQTDERTDGRGKTICLPTLSGGDIIMYPFETLKKEGHNSGLLAFTKYLHFSASFCITMEKNNPTVQGCSYT